MTRLFNLDFQLLHDTILMAISVFVLFTVMSYNLFEPVRKMLKASGEDKDGTGICGKQPGRSSRIKTAV